MSNITDVKRAVESEITNTDLTVALFNCFHTWDGEVDMDVISQGIIDRYRAMGLKLLNVMYVRKSLEEVEVNVQYGSSAERLTIIRAKKGKEPFMASPEFFHKEECEVLNEYLINNFYHK